MENTDTQENETETIQQISPDVVYQQDKASIDIQIVTAKAYPRKIRRATENALAIVTMDENIARTCTYSVPRGGKKISGPSVHLAKIIAQQWGNMRIKAKVVDIDQSRITSEAICWDLESNLAIEVQIKRSITGKTGRFSEDMITVTGNAANSIALRNAVLSVIPKGIVDKIYNAAKQTITGDISDKNKLLVKRKQVFDGLTDAYGVTEKEILFAIGKAAVDFVDGDDIITLVGIGQAIRDGDTTVEQAFKGEKTKENPISVEDLKKLRDEKMADLTATELLDINRIINGNEVTSFKKIFDLLQSKKTNEQNS
jgi:hypothetical protein